MKSVQVRDGYAGLAPSVCMLCRIMGLTQLSASFVSMHHNCSFFVSRLTWHSQFPSALVDFIVLSAHASLLALRARIAFPLLLCLHWRWGSSCVGTVPRTAEQLLCIDIASRFDLPVCLQPFWHRLRMRKTPQRPNHTQAILKRVAICELEISCHCIGVLLISGREWR